MEMDNREGGVLTKAGFSFAILTLFVLRPGGGFVPPHLVHLHCELRRQRDCRRTLRCPSPHKAAQASGQRRDQENALRAHRRRADPRRPPAGPALVFKIFLLLSSGPSLRGISLQPQTRSDQRYPLPGFHLRIDESPHPLSHRMVRVFSGLLAAFPERARLLVVVREFPDGSQAAFRIPVPERQGSRLSDVP